MANTNTNPKVTSTLSTTEHPETPPTYKALAKFAANGDLLSFEDQNICPNDTAPRIQEIQDEKDDEDKSPKQGFFKNLLRARRQRNRDIENAPKLEDIVERMGQQFCNLVESPEFTKVAKALAKLAHEIASAPKPEYIYVQSRRDGRFYYATIRAGKDDGGELLYSKMGLYYHLVALQALIQDLAEEYTKVFEKQPPPYVFEAV